MKNIDEKIEQLEKEIEELRRFKALPEYIKVVGRFFVEPEVIGKIFKTSDPFPNLSSTESLTWLRCLRIQDDNNQKYFEAATEEEYIEQNRIKPKYAVGDTIISNDESIFVVIKSIDNGMYSCYDEKRGQRIDYDMYIIDGAEYISKATDEKIIEVLKKHYKLEVGQEVSWGFRHSYYAITGFRIKKSSDKNNSSYSLGKSQLLIDIENPIVPWITPTKENFSINVEVEEKIEKISGHKVLFQVKNELQILTVGCQLFTKDSLVLIADILKARDLNKIEFESTAANHSVTFTLKELDKLIDKFDK